jgi:hypothetical protein
LLMCFHSGCSRTEKSRASSSSREGDSYLLPTLTMLQYIVVLFFGVIFRVCADNDKPKSSTKSSKQTMTQTGERR